MAVPECLENKTASPFYMSEGSAPLSLSQSACAAVDLGLSCRLSPGWLTWKGRSILHFQEDEKERQKKPGRIPNLSMVHPLQSTVLQRCVGITGLEGEKPLSSGSCHMWSQPGEPGVLLSYLLTLNAPRVEWRFSYWWVSSLASSFLPPPPFIHTSWVYRNLAPEYPKIIVVSH